MLYLPPVKVAAVAPNSSSVGIIDCPLQVVLRTEFVDPD